MLSALIISGCTSSKKALQESPNRYEFSAPHMGTTFRLIFYASSDSIANIAAQQSFAKIERLNGIFSDYEADSELNKLSGQSGSKRWVPVSIPLYDLLNRAVQVSYRTDGAFDITVGPFVKLWRNLANQYNPDLPSKDTLKALSKRVGYKKIMFDEHKQAIKLRARGMQLDAGGIAKGYTADKVLEVLKSHGIISALVDAGGDITVGEAPPKHAGWTISVPCNITAQQKGSIQLTLANKAIASSGDLFQHIIINGTRYSHIVNPKTGRGTTNQTTTNVIAPNGTTADAYASAFNVMPPPDAILQAQKNRDLQVNITYLTNDSLKTVSTPYFKRLRCTK